MSPINIYENTSSDYKIKVELEEIHCHVQVPSSNVLVTSLEKDEFPGIDEGNANLKENTNDENLTINMNKRKEVYPIHRKNKQFSNAIKGKQLNKISWTHVPIERNQSTQ